MIHQASKGIASLGRNGDSMLVHMNPNEVAGLQSLAMAQGGSLTINPDTGLPEAFSLGGFFTSILPTIVGGIVGGPLGMGAMGGLLSGAATGAGIAAAKGENALMGGLMGGMGGFGGAGLADAFKAAGASTIMGNSANAANIANAGNAASTTGGAGNLGMFTAGNAGTPGVGPETLFGQAGEYAQAGAPTIGTTPSPDFTAISNAGSSTSPGGFTSTFQSNLGQTGTGIKNLLGFGDTAGTQSAAWDAAKAVTPNLGTKLALAGGQGLLGGLEPSDLYGDPINRPDKDKYDPYATLNLSGDTGLRLLAQGGTVSGAGTAQGIESGGNYNTYNTSDSLNQNSLSKDGYGIGRLESLANTMSGAQAANYGKQQMFAHGGYLNGAGDGMSDSIPATIEGKQPARLADGEFVVPADVVSHLGNGSSKAGSKRLYSMLDKVRQARTGHKKQGRQINPDKYLPA
jgi:hypothetical protein